MAARGKSLRFEEEEVQDMADLPYGNRRVFPLLALLYGSVTPDKQPNVDHIFAQAMFSRKRLLEAGVPDGQIADYQRRANGLANLQLLDGPTNGQKQDMLPMDWVRDRFDGEVAAINGYLAMHDMTDLPAQLLDFESFHEARRARMVVRLRKLLSVQSQASAAVTTPG